MACCTGEEIPIEELGRTKGQKEMGTILLNIIKANIEKGATPFGGELSQPPDPGMLAAMNTMMNIGGYGAYDAPTMPSRPGGPIGPQPMAGPPVSGETPVGPTGSLPGVYPGTGVSGPSSKVNVPGPGPTGVGNVGPTGPSSRPDKPRPGPAYPRSNTWPQTGSGPPLASSNADPLSHAANVRDAYVGYGQDPVVPILPMLIYPGPVGRAGGPVGRADVRGYVGRQI